ncbi:MAG TPA: lipocalin family protein [Candidatus Acidoferrales bacterium]|jgi:hypothetical protein|nr:lipocalin family protein [Candidatus Acidoferrales bacterium]
MKATIWSVFLIAAACAFTLEISASGGPPDSSSQALIGTWNYESFIYLEDGWTVHFKAGQWTQAFNEDGTWTRSGSLGAPSEQTGTYKTHGHDLIIKYSDGTPDEKYYFKIEKHGKTLTLEGQKIIIKAIRK